MSQNSLTTSSSGGPSAHSSLVGGSTADRRMGCHASYQEEQKVPAHIRNKSSGYADEGSALHACIEYILQENIYEDELDEKIVGREFGDPPYVMTRKLVDSAIIPCMDFIDALIEELKDEGEFRFELETQCEMPGIPGAFGTSDFIFRTDMRSGIVDWKFGEGVPVKAEYKEKDDAGNETVRGNSQLLYYGRAAMNTLPDMFETADDWPIDLYVVQPRTRDGGAISKHETDVYGLEEFRLKLVDAIEKNKAANPRPKQGPWCTFAACKSVCPLHTGALLDMAKLGALARSRSKEEIAAFDWPKHMALLLEIAGIADEAIKLVHKQAHQHLEEGGQILDETGEPAWKLVPKKATEKYVDEAGAAHHAIGLGVPEAKAYEPAVVKSPAQLAAEIEPLIDKTEFKTKKDRTAEARRQLREFTVTASSGTTLAPADDSRPDVTPTPQLVADFASKLAALRK